MSDSYSHCQVTLTPVKPEPESVNQGAQESISSNPIWRTGHAARLHRLAESIPGLLKRLKIRAQAAQSSHLTSSHLSERVKNSRRIKISEGCLQSVNTYDMLWRLEGQNTIIFGGHIRSMGSMCWMKDVRAQVTKKVAKLEGMRGDGGALLEGPEPYRVPVNRT